MNTKHYFLAALLLLASLSAPRAAAQSRETRPTFKNGISIEPLYLFVGGLRLNYERQIINPRHGLEISAIGYTQRRGYTWELFEYSSSDFDKAWQLGTEVNYKYLVAPFMYFSLGAAYAHRNGTYEAYTETFHKYTEDGLIFWTTKEGYQTYKHSGNRIAGNLRLGFQSRSNRRIIVGGYIGVSYIHTFEEPVWYDSSFFNYTGFLPSLGFKIGTRF